MFVLWKWVDSKELTKKEKTRAFLWLNSLLFSVLGLLAWLIVRSFALNTWEWALCFVGYFGFFFGYIGGFLYLCRR